MISFLLGACLAEYALAVFLFLGFLFWQIKICASAKIAGKKMAIYAAILLAAFLTGMARGRWRERESQRAETFFTEGKEVKALGKLYQKEQKKEEFYYYLKDCKLQSSHRSYSCSKILVILDTDTCSIGEILFVKGKIKVFERPSNEGGYDARKYYQSLNLEGAVEGGTVEKKFGKENRFLESLYQIRLKLKGSYESCMKPSHAGVMTAMSLGDKSGMEQDLKTLYQKAGVSHFYSISGIHLSILGMTLFGLLRKGNCSYGISSGIAGGIVLCYGHMTGFGISQTRAIGMFLLLLYGKCRGKSYDRMTALTLLAALMVWENPKIINHMGFLLSFGAVAGVLLGEWVKASCALEELSGMKDTLFVSACIQIVTIPLLCNSFYEISIYAILVNLFILPCMGALLGLGIAGGVAGCLCLTAGKIILFPCSLILWMFETVCRFFLKLPQAVFITGKLSLWRVLLWYGSIFVFLVFKHRAFCLWRIPACLAICGAVLIFPVKRHTEWNILDVGQGDGICFMEKDGTSMFLDGGSTSVSEVGTYRILPFLKYHGIRSVDYWFLSHLDEDHINGMVEVAESGFLIGCLVMAEGVVRDEAWEDMVKLAEKYGISLCYMRPGSGLLGAGGDWKITCLFPPKDSRESDRNNASLVFLYESGDLRGLFTGDLSAGQEREIVGSCKLPEIDVLKASHHGSRYGTCQELLEEVSPKAAVISCGKHNSYGHPGQEVVERLEQSGCGIYRTDESGALRVYGKDGEVVVEEFIK